MQPLELTCQSNRDDSLKLTFENDGAIVTTIVYEHFCIDAMDTDIRKMSARLSIKQIKQLRDSLTEHLNEYKEKILAELGEC
jgi:hypothetical protein